eukprot:TRINITY_DN2254_c0_g1_i1.p2 TRINITY_DN2254_c0_g1~~TRINITY_DN2254_c0_g1_i1.p2  ORF type:complete len:436 (-),score=89.83 TRINITY_DN2254_c0_g1_i1:1747-3054(-)
MSKPVLEYFNIKARNAVPMIALTYAGVDYDFKVVDSDWAAIKPTCPFGQVPVLRDGDTVVSQTLAIAEYVAFKFAKNLLGETPQDFASSAALLQLSEEIFVGMVKSHYHPADKTAAWNQYFDTTLPGIFKNLEKLMNADNKFTNAVTLGELAVFAVLSVAKDLQGDILDNFTKMSAWFNNLANDEKVKKFTAALAGCRSYFKRTSYEIQFGYWDIRGLASSFRLFFQYMGIKFTDNQYSCVKKEDGSWDRSAWADVAKPPLKAREPLMNLPYLVDGDNVVTQTNAIWSYLGRTYNMYGDDETTRSRVDMILCQTMDLRNSFVSICYGSKENLEKQRPTYGAQTAGPHLAKFEATLGKWGTNFIASNNVTIADFHTWDMLDQHTQLLGKDYLQEYPLLKAYYDRVGNLPATVAYKQTAAYKLPLNNKSASFGATPP